MDMADVQRMDEWRNNKSRAGKTFKSPGTRMISSNCITKISEALVNYRRQSEERKTSRKDYSN